jgi:hypothetical protein
VSDERAGPHRWKRATIVVVSACLALAVLAVAALVFVGRFGPESVQAVARPDGLRWCRSPFAIGVEQIERCRRHVLRAAIDREGERALPALEREAARYWNGGLCHQAMHGVARAWVRDEGLELEDVRARLPEGRSGACTSGFTHGVLTRFAAQIESPGDAAAFFVASCAWVERIAAKTNCVHGLGHTFMRANDGNAARATTLCLALPMRWQGECSPGIYHDTYLGTQNGFDGAAKITPDQAADVCADAPDAWVRTCWYYLRRVIEPATANVTSIDDVTEACSGVRPEVARLGCLTGASLTLIQTTPFDEHVRACGELPLADVTACLWGVGTIVEQPATAIAVCDRLDGPETAECIRWFSHVQAVYGRDSIEELRAACSDVDWQRPKLSVAACDEGIGRRLTQAIALF